MPQRVEFIIYFVGVILLGLAYYALKHAVSPPVFGVGVLAYLVLLSILGRFVAAKLTAKAARGESDA